jgi:outer membrane protein assembly factor BamC
MKIACAAASVLLAILVSSCSSGLDRRYLDATLTERLELPPDLIESSDDSSFELPSTITADGELGRGQVPVVARVESLKLESSGDMYWLSVEQPVDDLYRMVRNFWSEEGYQLIVDEPAIGIMQTEWIYKEVGGDQRSDNWFLRIFDSSDLSASQDQFRTRIERGPGDENRIYIAHRGTEYQHVFDPRDTGRNTTGDETEDSQWRFRQPDPELEIEMLSRLMLYLGLRQAEVEAQVADVRLYAPQAFMHLDSEENSPYLIIKSPYQIAWNRILHQLDRLNFEVEKKEFKSGLTEEGVITVKTLMKEESDDGGFFSFFSGSDTQQRRMVLVLSEETHELTRVDIENSAGDFDSSPEAVEFINLLYRQIR